MGKAQKEVSARSQSSEIQKLNDRVDDMAAMFSADLKQFKQELLGTKKRTRSTSVSSETDGSTTSLIQKFTDFEQQVHNTLSSIKGDIAILQKESIRHSNHVNHNSVVLHGVADDEKTDLYESIQSIFATKLDIPITKSDINFCYRLGQSNKHQNSAKPRPVVVCLCHRWKRDQIFFNKKRLKGSKLLITELLCVGSLQLFKSAQEHFKGACWTVGGKVYVLVKGRRVYVESVNVLEDIINKSLD